MERRKFLRNIIGATAAIAVKPLLPIIPDLDKPGIGGETFTLTMHEGLWQRLQKAPHTTYTKLTVKHLEEFYSGKRTLF